MRPVVEIGPRLVGPGHPCLVIAEAGVNHDGDSSKALRLIDAAAVCGADAVKFQTFSASALATASAQKAAYQLVTTPAAESQLGMLKRLELPAAAYADLAEHAARAGLMFLSTPFDRASADLLDLIAVPAFKISSGDATNGPLLRHVARKRRPVLLSTGMCSIAEVRDALDVFREEGNDSVVLLHCVSQYPAPIEDANLRAMAAMRSQFGTPVGLSDHFSGFEAAISAVALGASVIEKHLTIDRTAAGPDHASSLEPAEFAKLVRAVRVVERALGDGEKRLMPSEAVNLESGRRSLVAAGSINTGEIIDAAHLDCRRPATGLSPMEFDRIVGRRATRPIAPGEILTRDAVEGLDD